VWDYRPSWYHSRRYDDCGPRVYAPVCPPRTVIIHRDHHRSGWDRHDKYDRYDRRDRWSALDNSDFADHRAAALAQASRPAVPVTQVVHAGPAAPTRVAAAPASQPAKAAPRPAPRPPVDEAWAALAAGDAGAMEKFGRLIGRDSRDGSAELGYAICAARAGQAERAEWGARWAFRKDAAALTKAAAKPGVQAAAVAALARYSADTAAAPDRADAAYTAALLSVLAGDKAGAAAKVRAPALAADTDASTKRLRAALAGVKPASPAAAPKPADARLASKR
jgi:hypothetical protein